MTQSNDKPGLQGFLEAAGRSLSGAQGQLVGEALETPALAISDAELEVKAAVAQGADGSLSLQTFSAAEVRRGGVNASLLSTLRVSYVAVASEASAPPAVRNPVEVAEGVREMPDIVALGRILGRLEVDPVFVADRGRWLVSVRDAQGRLVRELILPDEARQEGGRA